MADQYWSNVVLAMPMDGALKLRMAGLSSPHIAAQSAPVTLCPSCRRGVLVSVAAVDGLLREGCRECYYSRVVGAH